MKIGIDIDGVIADFTGAFLPELNKYCSCELNDIVNYDFDKNIQVKIDKEQYEKLWSDIEGKRIYKELKLIEGSGDALRKISKGNTILLISNRKKEAEKDTVIWLKKHKIPFTKLILVDSLKEKIIKMKECDLILEDNLEVARMISNLGIPILLFDYPWNRINKKIRRIKDWKQAVREINKRR